MAEQQKTETGFKDLLNSVMTRRWYITAIVLGGFVLIIGGIFVAISFQTPMAAAWKELLMLLLGAFIGSYGKIIDYWFSDQDKDKMLVAKMDEENDSPEILMAKMDKGISSGDLKLTGYTPTQIVPDAFVAGASAARDLAIVENKQNFELEKAEQQHKHEMEKLEFEHHEHRLCNHVWGDADGNGELECQICGKIKDPEPHHDMEG
jgi:hypothetical protein